MNDYKAGLKGSEARDLFKQLHKTEMCRWDYATDIDLRLIAKDPVPHIPAHLDFKREGDGITFAETISNNHDLKEGIPVYIITGQKNFTELTPEEHRFSIDEYLGGNYIPEPPDVDLRRIADNLTWAELRKWEKELRDAAQMKVRKQEML